MPNPNDPAPVLLSRERAIVLLQPYLEILNQCVDAGWTAWKEHYAHRAHLLDGRPRAAIIYAEIVDFALKAFHDLEGVKVVRRPSSLMIYIGEEITLRFKKMRSSGLCSNVRTVTQLRLLAQLQLPGMLEGTLVHAGYQLDNSQQNVVRKAIVCQLRKRVLWDIEITGTPAEIVTMPPAPTQPHIGPRFVAKDELVGKPADANEKKG